MHPASYWHARDGGAVQCTLCPRNCVIPPGELGECHARGNSYGELVSYNYGIVTAAAPDPVEKKPLYHFHPGSKVFSIGTYGCNLHCDFCQNHGISQVAMPPHRRLLPGEIIRSAKDAKCTGIAFTYSEPVVWAEYVVDVASQYDGDRILVSNGYINKKPLRDMAAHLDAANIDVKGGKAFYESLCHAPYHDSLSSIKLLYDLGVHVEVTTLVIPGGNDSDGELRGMAEGIARVSPDIPLHISRFFPSFRMGTTPPTPPETMERARQMAGDAGLRYVYLGNIAADDNTYCPSCASCIVCRDGYRVGKVSIAQDVCHSCGQQIYGNWKTIKK